MKSRLAVFTLWAAIIPFARLAGAVDSFPVVILEKAGRLAAMGEPRVIGIVEGRGVVRLSLPRQAGALLVLHLN